MTTDHMELRRVAEFKPGTIEFGSVVVSRIALAELLAAYDALAGVGKKSAKSSTYSPEFEEVWAEYPKRGNHSKAGAYMQWKKRIKEGSSVEAMVEGMRRFAAVMVAEGRANDKILHAETFFGPSKRYEDEWIVPRSDIRRVLPARRDLQSQQDAANAEAKRRLFGDDPVAPEFPEWSVIDAT